MFKIFIDFFYLLAAPVRYILLLNILTTNKLLYNVNLCLPSVSTLDFPARVRLSSAGEGFVLLCSGLTKKDPLISYSLATWAQNTNISFDYQNMFCSSSVHMLLTYIVTDGQGVRPGCGGRPACQGGELPPAVLHQVDVEVD